ncbi:MAG: hypothetical protein M1839_004936 [Geoglossum umbratile]|nr:MAG: hypothetical protein M1839_004936 [Geoglossum umbratile]
MRLQVQVLPLQERRYAGKASLPSITYSHQHPNLPPGALSFLEICEDSISLNELCTKICARFARIYPQKPPLNIKKLQDVYENDLDLEYTVRDVFDDKSADQQNSVVRVLQAPATRDSSVPPQSALRPHIHGLAGRKRTHGGLGSSREGIVVAGAEKKRSEPRSGRSGKRQRIQEISRDEEEEVDPDLPLPSKEPGSEAVADLMQWTGAGQESSPSRTIGAPQPPLTRDSQTHTHRSSQPLLQPSHQEFSDTLTVPESPTHQARHQPVNDQSLLANGQANGPDEETAKSEPVDDNNGLLHSIPRSSIGSPFQEGEGIVAENPVIASQDHRPPLPMSRAQTLQDKEPSGGSQSIITPSSTPGASAHQLAKSSNKLKRPNLSMFKSSSRPTSSPEGDSNMYDAIESDEGGSPYLPPLHPRPEKRSKRHSSFTSIMNGQSPMPNTSNQGNSRHSSDSEGTAAKFHNKKSISPLEVKWLRDHNGSRSQTGRWEGECNSQDGGDSNHAPKKEGKQSTVREKTPKERTRRDARVKVIEEEGGKATAEAGQQQPEKDMEEHIEITKEQIKLLRKTAQEAEEIQRREEEARIAREADERLQKEAEDERRKEDERRANEAKAKEKQLEKERQNRERKERAQKQAQEKALKAEKAEREAEARRLAKKKEEEKAPSEAAEKGRPQRTTRRRAQEVEKASSGNKGKRAEQLPLAPPTEATKSSKPRGGRRISTTPLIPRAVIPKDPPPNGYDADIAQKRSVRNSSLDPQTPTPREQGAPMRRSVSFLVDEAPQAAPNPLPSSSTSINPSTAPAPSSSQIPRRVTKVYPPGMGPDSLKSLMEISTENPITATPTPKGKSAPNSKKGANVKRVANPNLKKSTNRKATDGKLAPNPTPKPALNPTPTREIVISSEGSDSGSSYHSEADSGGETITVLTPARPATVSAPAPSNPTSRTDKEDDESKSKTAAPILQSQSLPGAPPKAPPRISSPARSPVRYISRSPSDSDSYTDSRSPSPSSGSESVSSSDSESSSHIPSRSRSDSIGEADSDDEDAEGSASASSQTSSRPLPQADKRINGDRDEAISDASSGSKGAVNRLNSTIQRSTQRPMATPTNKASDVRSPVTANSSQAKPSLNSFPSLSQLGSQKFGHDSQERRSAAGSQKSFPSRGGTQAGTKPMPTTPKEDEEPSSSSDDESSDDDGSDGDSNNGLPQDRRARDSGEPGGKVSRGLKGLLSGMFLWGSTHH